MSPLYDLLTILIGFSSGILYGLLFVAQKSRFPAPSATATQLWFYRITAILVSILRITLLMTMAYYLLRSPTIPFILILLSFLAGFWFLVVNKKV